MKKQIPHSDTLPCFASCDNRIAFVFGGGIFMDTIKKENSRIEEWVYIPGFKRYQVSNFGKLRSMRYRGGKNIRLMTPSVSDDGYLKTMILSDDGKYKTVAVHRLIAMTFLGKEKGLVVNHKNGIKTDNSVFNLEYCTSSENALHSYKIGLQKKAFGSSNHMSVLSDSQVSEIRIHRDNINSRYYGLRQLSEKYGVSITTISKIINKKDTCWINV